MFKWQVTILTIFKYYYYLPTSHKRLSRSIKFYMYLFFKIWSEVLEMDDDYGCTTMCLRPQNRILKWLT